MRSTALARAIVVVAAAPWALPADSAITAPAVTVGRYLQTYTSVRLPQAAPEAGLRITLTSDDPSRLLLSTAPDKAGSATITLTAQRHTILSPEFFLQGLGDAGTVTYTVSAEGMGSGKGTVNLAPSAILIVGPDRIAKFPTTPRGNMVKLTLVSAALDATHKVVGEQSIAAGHQVEVALANSNPNAGKLGAAKLALEGGASVAFTSFQPAAEGDASITPVQPAGFTVPAEYTNVTVAVGKPGLAIVADLYLGKDLQIPGILCLGDAAPAGGLQVTLTSSDGRKMVLSTKEDQLGKASITLQVPAGALTAGYFIQGLGDAGEVTYEASAPGYRTRSGRIGLAPSGVIVAYEPYGPPDEASVLRNVEEAREFYASLAESRERKLHMGVWTAYLDPRSGRAADMTVQSLRAGVTASVDLKSSNPEVATVESPLVIQSGANHVVSRFLPITKGKTVITVTTPTGFTKPKNATSVPATVSD